LKAVRKIEHKIGIRAWRKSAGLGRFIKYDIFWQSTIVFLESIVCCGFSYLYQIYVGRAVCPEGYGAFGSLFAIINLISVFSGAVQVASNRNGA
jgi:hypothetical protein